MTERRIIRADLEGWGAIAEYLKRSIRTAERWAEREDDPLPVSRLGGVVVAYSARIDSWVERNTK